MRWHTESLEARSLGPWASDWDALLERLWGGHAVLSANFVDGLLRHFGTGREHLAVGRADDGSILAMCIVRRQRAGIWASFLPAQAQVGPTLMRDASAVPGLLRALPGCALQLDFLCHDDRFGHLDPPRGRAPASTWHALTTSIALHGGFDAYWRSRGTKLQQNLRRYNRKLAERGQPRFSVTSDRAGLPAAIQRYAALESAGWKGQRGTAINDETGQLPFYLDVMLTAVPVKGAEVHELWLGDQLLASRLVMSCPRMIVMLKTTYDERFSDCAPGVIMLQEVIRQAFERHPGKSLEFYTNASRDQLAWSTGRQAIRHISHHRRPAVGELMSLLRLGRTLLRGGALPFSGGSATETLVSFDTFEGLPADVLALIEQTEQQRFEFGVHWHATRRQAQHPQDGRLSLHVLRQEGRAVALLPLRLPPVGGGEGTPALPDHALALYAPALAPKLGALELSHLVRGIVAAQGTPETLRFGPMDPASREFAVLRDALSLAGLFTSQSLCGVHPRLSGLTTWADCIASRPPELSQAVHDATSLADRDGIRFEIIAGGDRLAVGLDAHQRCLLAEAAPEAAAAAAGLGMVTTCTHRAGPRIGVAWQADRPVATQVWIVEDGRAAICAAAGAAGPHGPALQRFVTARLLAAVLDEGLAREVVDMSGRDILGPQWHSSWMERWSLAAFPAASPRGLLRACREIATCVTRQTVLGSKPGRAVLTRPTTSTGPVRRDPADSPHAPAQARN